MRLTDVHYILLQISIVYKLYMTFYNILSLKCQILCEYVHVEKLIFNLILHYQILNYDYILSSVTLLNTVYKYFIHVGLVSSSVKHTSKKVVFKLSCRWS